MRGIIIYFYNYYSVNKEQVKKFNLVDTLNAFEMNYYKFICLEEGMKSTYKYYIRIWIDGKYRN